MTETQKAIIRRCYAKQQEIACSRQEAWRSYQLREWQQQMDHGPTYQVSEWFGAMPERDRVHYRRSIRALESRGLLTVWCRWGQRMTNIKLTDAGELEAKRLTDG